MCVYVCVYMSVYVCVHIYYIHNVNSGKKRIFFQGRQAASVSTVSADDEFSLAPNIAPKASDWRQDEGGMTRVKATILCVCFGQGA